MNLPDIQLEAIGPLWMEAAVVLVTLAVFGYSVYATRHQTPKVRVLVGVLRFLLLGLGLLLLHHPTLTRSTTAPQEKRLAVVVDRSGSMGADNDEGISRYEKAYETVARIPEDVQFDVFELDQSLSEPLGRQTRPRKLSGNKTDFHTSFSRLFSEYGDYTSVLLLSDGHDLGRLSQMSSEDTGRWLERLGAPPVNTVLIGSKLSGPEVAIHSIDAPGFSFVRAPLRIRATVIVRNLDKHETQVQLLQDDKVINIKDLVLDDQGFGTVEFEIYPEQQGEHLYSVYVPPHHLESNTENNRQQVLIDIGRDKINVLHIAGSITWDLHGLRDMFERHPLVDLTAFYIMRTRTHLQQGVDNRMIPHDEMALVPFPTEEIFDRQLFGFDVVFFHDFDAGTYFSDSYQARRLNRKIKEFVTEHRGGFVVVGGPRTAGGPSLGLTPLADILPLVPPIHRLAYDEQLYEGQLTDKGLKHPILRAYDPEFQVYSGAMQSLTVGKGADILIQDENNKPLLAVGEPGNGRVLFLNTSSSWKWRRDALAGGKTGDAYYDFWDQAIKWVIQDPALNQVRITATKTTADPLSVDMDVLLRDKSYNPAKSKDTQIIVTPLDGKSDPATLALSTDLKGAAQVRYTADRPGYYRIELAEEPWKTLSRANTVFLGGSQDELRNLDLVPETLQRLSTLSSARFAASADDFRPESLAWGKVQEKTIVETQRLKLRNWIWCLPLMILIVAIEWAVRRSSHLA
ncbi:MAG: hypothetical protein QNK37_33090 [Acidobacteriota bacterium]|nr:hypothetical protein [Acidobacteriota bacterium]